LIAFLLIATVVIVSPGPDFALTVRNTVMRGRSAGAWTSAGVVSGQLVWACAATAGIAALLVASRPAFLALRLVGAAYLVYLGVQALVASWRGSRHHEEARSPGGSPYTQGLLSNVGNPKMAIFFTSLLPQAGDSFAALLGHALLFSGMSIAWLAFVVRVGDALRVPTVRRIVDAVTGVVLVAFGTRLAVVSDRA
jgi:threonine/homoserine/homoserine lactone efflux protein